MHKTDGASSTSLRASYNRKMFFQIKLLLSEQVFKFQKELKSVN